MDIEIHSRVSQPFFLKKNLDPKKATLFFIILNY